jgi:hypothetical protein
MTTNHQPIIVFPTTPPSLDSIMSIPKDLLQRIMDKKHDPSTIVFGITSIVIGMSILITTIKSTTTHHHHKHHQSTTTNPTTTSTSTPQKSKSSPTNNTNIPSTHTKTSTASIKHSPIPEWAVPARGSYLEDENDTQDNNNNNNNNNSLNSSLPHPPPIHNNNINGNSTNTNNFNFFHPTHQTQFDATKGNALQACVASILGLQLHQVPNFVTFPEPYDELRHFLSLQGLGFTKIELKDGVLPFPPYGTSSFCILAGRSPRGNFRHAIVARLSANSVHPQAYFDPHPDNTMLKSMDWVGLFVKVMN